MRDCSSCCIWRYASLLTKTGNSHFLVDTQTYFGFVPCPPPFISLENLKYVIVTRVKVVQLLAS